MVKEISKDGACPVSTMRQTEIGLLPEDWEVRKLNDIGVFSKGKGISKTEANSGSIPAIRYGELYTKHHSVIRKFYSFISSQVASNSIKLKKGDILFAGSGETKGEIGKSVAFIDDEEAFVGGDIVILSPNKNCDPTFLGYLLNSKEIQKQKSANGQGDAVVHIYSSSLKDIQIPLPPLPEQEAIAEALSDADAWIESLEQLIAKKRLIKQGAMQELLSHSISSGRAKEDWEERKLGELGEVKMCKRIFQYQTSEFGEIPFYKIGTFGKIPDAFISRNHYQDFKNKFSFPKKGEILISAAGTVGRTVVYDGEECYFQDSNIVWINNQEEIVSNKFLKYILEVVKYNTEGGTIQRLYNSILKDTTFHCPSLAEQTRIATILSDMDAELEALEAQLGKARKIKQGMMQELLTGRIRLIDNR